MDFSIVDISTERKNKIRKCARWSDDCPVSMDLLKEVCFLHKDFSGTTQNGSIIVLDEIADSVLAIFKKLFMLEFPIHKAVPIDYYNGSDIASMNDNNTSAFNCRKVMNSNSWSSHSYGVAIDINPIQNPYVLINHERAEATIYPKSGTMFLNRKLRRHGMVETVIKIFSEHGFTDWGGNWESLLDYHHFQVPWEDIKNMQVFNKSKV